VLALCPLPPDRVAVAGASGTVTILSVHPDGRLETGQVLRGPAGPVRSLCMLTYPGGRSLLAAAGDDAAIWTWDLSSCGTQAAGRMTGHAGRIWSLAVVPGDSPRLASAGADRTVRVWDPAAVRALGRPLAGHADQVRAVTAVVAGDGAVVAGDGAVVLASRGHDGTVRLWEPATGAPRAVIPLGIPVHALLQQRPDPLSAQRTSGGATVTVGLRTGILALDLHRDLLTGADRARLS
jgi:WD40 repeat protein